MAKDKYVSPEGFTVDVLEAFPYHGKGLACLVVQANEDRDVHGSTIHVCDDFSTGDPLGVFNLKGWIYSMHQPSDNAVWIAHSGKKLRYGPHDDPAVVLEVKADITKLCASFRGIFIVGLNGYVAHFDGRQLVEMPVPGAEDIYYVSEAPDGTVFAAGGKDGLYRLDGTAWTPIELHIGSEIYRIRALGARSVLLVGSEGLCGHWQGDELILFTPPDRRDYYAIAPYRGRIFVGAGFRGLEVIDGDAVVPFKDNIYTYYLHADDTWLIASGLNEVARYDGQGWLAAEFT